MRQVYTSPRLENVEAVAALLEKHGIEARIVNGRSYRGGIRGDFSYRQRPERGEEPSVWVVRSDDRPKARELLRDQGLIEDSRRRESYLQELTFADAQGKPRRRGFGLRTLLLLGAAAGLGLAFFGKRAPAPEASAPADAAAAAQGAAAGSGAGSDTYIVDTPSALAAMLIDAELQAQGAAEACLSVDGADPSPRVLAQLRNETGVRLRGLSECTAPGGAVRIGVRGYRTDGSGKGTVQLQIADTGPDGADRTEARTLEVRRIELEWEVTGVRL